MMSSEEDTDSFGLYGDKLLKKTKRARQRVDAGEPRNSYSSIPNFSSRPSLMSGGLYGAICSQNQQHFGLFSPGGYGTTKMLNELLARQVKQAQDASGPDNAIMQQTTLEGAINSDGNKICFESANAFSSPAIRRGSSTPPQPSDLAHHMLRNILQGKKELMALDQELCAANHNNSAISVERSSPDNNNSISKNNNTNGSSNNIVKQEVNIKSESVGELNDNDLGVNSSGNISRNGNGGVQQMNHEISRHNLDCADESAQSGMQNRLKHLDGQTISNNNISKNNHDDIMDDDMVCLNSRSDSENSLSSMPGSDENLLNSKEDLDMELQQIDKATTGSPNMMSGKNEPVALDMKRARVENIVSTMRSSPGLSSNQPQVNGCKKRKLYHPQQHDNSAAERYAAVAAGLNLGLHIQSLMLNDDEDDDDHPQIHQKRVEKNALESQLRSMQEKLAEMQQKYVQLCSIIEHTPETQEIDDAASDIVETLPDQLKDSPDKSSSNAHSLPSSPALSPMKEMPTTPKSNHNATNMLTQVMGKMITSKLHSQMTPQAHLPPGFNGSLPLLQHITHGGPPVLNSHDHPIQHPHAQHSHHAFNNAAAMYLGMGQKFLMDQEARMQKENAEQQERMQQQQQQQQQQQLQQQQQERQQVQQQQMPQQHQHQPPQQQQSNSQNTSPQTHHSPQQQQQQQQQPSSLQQSPQIPKGSTVPSDLSDRLNIMRSNPNSMGPVSNNDFEGLASGLADVLKSEITASLTNLVDSIVTRFIHQRRFLNKQTEAAAAAAEQLNKDLMMATQMLDRKSPRTKQSERANNVQSAAMFQAPKPPQGMNSVAAAALYNSMNVLGGHPNLVNPFCKPEMREHNPEQNEALSLVVAPKKKRHKVTDTRITPRTVSRILAQDGIGPPPGSMDQCNNSNNNLKPYNPPASTPSDSPSSRSSYHAPPSSMMPVSLPTSVAIPNPSLHESQVFSPYSPFFNPHGPHGPHTPQAAQLHHMKMSSSPPGYGGMMDPRDSPPLPHPPTMLHPALLAAAHHGSSPDYAHMRAAMDANDRNSDCNSADITYEGVQPTSATLTPMHLRKAKLMFFWVRYPSSQVLKMYFPDIKFNKNNTAQLVKWFSNFREFYYIQMEKYARQAVSEGVKSADDLHVSGDSEIYRVLNLHYNRNNHIEVPQNFRFVIEQTLREFFRAIQGGKDTEQSWKKSIYKVISRMDDPVPEYFKSPNFLEQLE